MHFEGVVTINASRQKVWDFLTDPNLVSQCAPGLKSMDVVVPDKKFHAVVSIGFGSMKTTFDTEIEWGELDPLNRATITAHATAPGSAVDVTSEMVLSEGAALEPEAAGSAESPGGGNLWARLVAFFKKLFGISAPSQEPVSLETTELRWEAEIVVVGRIKSTASRFMGSVSKQLSKAFFDCVKRKIET